MLVGQDGCAPMELFGPERYVVAAQAAQGSEKPAQLGATAACTTAHQVNLSSSVVKAWRHS